MPKRRRCGSKNSFSLSGRRQSWATFNGDNPRQQDRGQQEAGKMQRLWQKRSKRRLRSDGQRQRFLQDVRTAFSSFSDEALPTDLITLVLSYAYWITDSCCLAISTCERNTKKRGSPVAQYIGPGYAAWDRLTVTCPASFLPHFFNEVIQPLNLPARAIRAETRWFLFDHHRRFFRKHTYSWKNLAEYQRKISRALGTCFVLLHIMAEPPVSNGDIWVKLQRFVDSLSTEHREQEILSTLAAETLRQRVWGKDNDAKDERQANGYFPECKLGGRFLERGYYSYRFASPQWRMTSLQS